MLPKELQDILSEAKEAIIEHPKGELILPIRKKIWRSLGEIKMIREETAIPTVGLQRRLELARLCVEKVMYIWKEVMGGNKRPLKMIELAEKHIEGSIDSELIIHQYNDFVNLLNSISTSVKYKGAVSLGFAAIHVADIALGDEVLIVNNEDKELDDDLDIDSYDTSYNACIAYTGGEPWVENSSIEKRREFWFWYINEAVPQAYLKSDTCKIVSLIKDEEQEITEILNPTKQQLINMLNSLDKFESYIMLENYSGKGIESYIEMENAFGDIRVNVRIYSHDDMFKQWAMGWIEDDSDETISFEMIHNAFEAFMAGELLSEDLKWIDVTEI